MNFNFREKYEGSARVINIKNRIGKQVSNSHDACCIHINAFGKNMNPSLPTAMGQIVD